jgi:hypothetical protein
MHVGYLIWPISIPQDQVRCPGWPGEDLKRIPLRAARPRLTVHLTAISKTPPARSRATIIMDARFRLATPPRFGEPVAGKLPCVRRRDSWLGFPTVLMDNVKGTGPEPAHDDSIDGDLQ